MAITNFKTRTISSVIYVLLTVASWLHWMAFAAFILFVGIIAFIELLQMFRNKSKKTTILQVIFAIFYIGMPLLLIQFLYRIHWSVAAVIFVMLWFNDAGAYIIGSAVGKHKLCEKISPSKTWEGFFGGMIATLMVAFGIYCLSHCSSFIIHCSFNHIWFCLVFAAIVSIFGTLGDLFESMLKRRCNVKDSGKIMPGHGGALDRFDSLLFATIAISILYSILCIYTKKVI